jgi:hypothetical protein
LVWATLLSAQRRTPLYSNSGCVLLTMSLRPASSLGNRALQRQAGIEATWACQLPMAVGNELVRSVMGRAAAYQHMHAKHHFLRS